MGLQADEIAVLVVNLFLFATVAFVVLYFKYFVAKEEPSKGFDAVGVEMGNV